MNDCSQLSLSNRRENRKVTFTALGLDRLSLSFAVDSFEPDPRAWDMRQERFVYGEESSVLLSARVKICEGVMAFVGVKTFGASGARAKVEFNPARVSDPDGVSLASVEETLGASAAALAAARDLVLPESPGDLASFMVKRVDVARDFSDVLNPSGLIRGLAPIRRKYAKKNLVHADPARNGAQTLLVGNGTGATRLYDKCAESVGKAAPGTLRWEAECRTGWAWRYGGIASLADLSDNAVLRLAADRWEWSGMSVEVSSVAGVVDVLARSELTEREQCMFLGWLVGRSSAHGYRPSAPTERKFHRLQRQLGLSIGPESLQGVTVSSRLDWESGTEVCCVA